MPGRQEYLGPTTVLKAVESAGGFTDQASRTKVKLTAPKGETQIIDCVAAAKNPALDSPVFPGYKIEVPLRHRWSLFR